MIENEVLWPNIIAQEGSLQFLKKFLCSTLSNIPLIGDILFQGTCFNDFWDD